MPLGIMRGAAGGLAQKSDRRGWTAVTIRLVMRSGSGCETSLSFLEADESLDVTLGWREISQSVIWAGVGDIESLLACSESECGRGFTEETITRRSTRDRLER